MGEKDQTAAPETNVIVEMSNRTAGLNMGTRVGELRKRGRDYPEEGQGQTDEKGVNVYTPRGNRERGQPLWKESGSS